MKLQGVKWLFIITSAAIKAASNHKKVPFPNHHPLPLLLSLALAFSLLALAFSLLAFFIFSKTC